MTKSGHNLLGLQPNDNFMVSKNDGWGHTVISSGRVPSTRPLSSKIGIVSANMEWSGVDLT